MAAKAICVVRTRQERTGILYTDQRRMKRPEDILAAFGRLFERAGVEQLVAVALTQIGEPVAVQLMAVGGVNSCMVSVAEILKLALLSNTPGILLLHNHPSGSIRPSAEDRGITERVKTAAEIVGVHLVDHIIVGDMRHGYSILREQEIYLSEMEKGQPAVPTVENCGNSGSMDRTGTRKKQRA